MEQSYDAIQTSLIKDAVKARNKGFRHSGTTGDITEELLRQQLTTTFGNFHIKSGAVTTYNKRQHKYDSEKISSQCDIIVTPTEPWTEMCDYILAPARDVPCVIEVKYWVAPNNFESGGNNYSTQIQQLKEETDSPVFLVAFHNSGDREELISRSNANETFIFSTGNFQGKTQSRIYQGEYERLVDSIKSLLMRGESRSNSLSTGRTEEPDTCGDALGRPVKLNSADRIEATQGQVTGMIGRGTRGQPAGTITDDTEIALCIARSLADREQFDVADIWGRFVEWYEGGPFDIGGMTRRSLQRIQQGDSWDDAGQRVWEESVEGSNAGNGSVMRCAPLAIAYDEYPAALTRVSRVSLRITHADPRCTAGCAVLNLTIAALLNEVESPLEAALQLLADDLPTDMQSSLGVVPETRSPMLEGDMSQELREALQAVPDEVTDDDLSSSGYVVDTLQTALYDALTASSAEEAIISAVNRGSDTDTVGAITGAIAGARFGSDDLPERWLRELGHRDELEDLARALDAHSGPSTQ
jgi:ADP-ribosyl-[dinitrogen reductase] hydrolase